MIFVAILVIVCIADVPLVTAQQSSFCPSTLSDLNAYCDVRYNLMENNSRIGPRGPVGKSGPRGSKGSLGQQGPPGVEGLQGPRGEVGVKGSKGEKGDSGPRGLPGEQGLKGVVGNKGYQGAKGEKGSKGSHGVPGIQGIKGTVGEKGTNGAKGIVGPQGPIGGPGSKGSKGSVGLKGSIGNPGVMNSTAVEEIVNRIVNKIIPRSCKEVNAAVPSVRAQIGGTFYIHPESLGMITEVYCDLVTDGGGWTVFQKRMDGSEDFYRGWDDYVRGFGNKDKEFWLGLEKLHQMTKNGDYELRVDLTDFSGNTAYAKYGSFRIDSSAQNYKLHVSSYSGNAGDSLAFHNGVEFSTHDADHDTSSGNNCAQLNRGAWWYGYCHRSNLNSLYHDAVGSGSSGVVWLHWKSLEYLKFTEMKFRRK